MQHIVKFGVRPLSVVGAVAAALVTGQAAHAGLSFSVTYDPSFDAAAIPTVNAALAEYGALFNDNVTVSLKLKYSGGGLGTSSTYSFGVPYQTYYNALVADGTSAVDATALASLAPGGANNPVNGTGFIAQGRAGLAAIGIPIDTSGIPGYFDGEIDLNLGLMNYTRVGIDPNKYDLKAVLQHEVDEVLGTISNVGDGTPRPIDLFRYTAAGARTYTTVGDNAYFSIDGGATLLARFNQDGGGDYGDWWSVFGGNTPQVQDAFATPGSIPNLGVEINVLDSVGWTRIVPEPASLAALSVGTMLLQRRRTH